MIKKVCKISCSALVILGSAILLSVTVYLLLNVQISTDKVLKYHEKDVYQLMNKLDSLNAKVDSLCTIKTNKN